MALLAVSKCVVVIVLILVSKNFAYKRVNVQLKSTGCKETCVIQQDCGTISKCCPSSLNIAGTEYSPQEQGVTLAALDVWTGAVSAIKHFGSFKKGIAKEVHTFLEPLPHWTIVIFVTQRACRMLRGWSSLIRRKLEQMRSGPWSWSNNDAVIAVACKVECLTNVTSPIRLPYFSQKSSGLTPLSASFDVLVQDVATTTSGPLASAIFPTFEPKGVNASHEGNNGESAMQTLDDSRLIWIAGVCGGIGFFIVVIVVLLLLVKRRRSRSQKMIGARALMQSDENHDQNRHKSDCSSYYDPVLLKNPAYGGNVDTASICERPLIAKESVSSEAELYDLVPTPVSSTSPSKSALMLVAESEYINENNPTVFATYVQLTKESSVYKEPSSVPKFDPPTEKPPDVVKDNDFYLGMEDHVYASPNTSPYESIRFVIPTQT